MDRVLEGIDTLDPQLILEASKEFEAGVEELKKSIEGFSGILKKFPELKDLESLVSGAGARLDNLDLEKIPKEYSFKAHKKVLRSMDDDEQPDAVISDISLKIPATINALKDAILAIAQWFEEYPKLFSVGKDGILFQQEFLQTIADPKAIKINDFTGPGEEILSKISGKDGDEMRAHFEPLWKTEDIEPEKEDEAFEAFVTGFEKIGQGAQTAHDEASKVVKDAEPPPNIQKGAKSLGGMLQGVLKSLLGGGGSDETPDIADEINLIVGSTKEDDAVGLFALTFVQMQELIGEVIGMTETVNAAGGKALQGIDDQQKETMKPSNEEAAFVKELQAIVNDQELTVDVGAAAEEAGMKDGNTDTIDVPKFKEVLEKTTDMDEEQLKYLLDELEIEGGEEQEDSLVHDPLDDNYREPSEFERMAPQRLAGNGRKGNKKFLEFLNSKGVIDLKGEPTGDVTGKELDDLLQQAIKHAGLEVDRFSRVTSGPEDFEAFKKALTVQQESIFIRWAQLAGIIKG